MTEPNKEPTAARDKEPECQNCRYWDQLGADAPPEFASKGVCRGRTPEASTYRALYRGIVLAAAMWPTTYPGENCIAFRAKASR